MTNPNAAGKRFLCNGGVCSLISYAHNLAEEFEPQGYSCTTKAVPYLAVWIGSFFDKQVCFVLFLFCCRFLVSCCYELWLDGVDISYV